jgi:uncharacterized membrane protein
MKIVLKLLIIIVLCVLIYSCKSQSNTTKKNKLERSDTTDDIIDDQMEDYRQELQQELEENND